MTTSAPSPSPGVAAECRDELAPLRTAADDLGRAARVGDAGGEHQPDRPGAEDRDAVALLDLRALDAAQAARKWLDHRRHLRREAGGDGEEVDARDPLRHEHVLGVGAVQELERPATLVACSRVRGDDPLAGRDVDAAELVPERARQVAEQDGVPAAEGLQVGAVGEGDLDLDEHVAGAGLRLRHVFEPEIPGAVEPERPHGVKTTLSARPER